MRLARTRMVRRGRPSVKRAVLLRAWNSVATRVTNGRTRRSVGDRSVLVAGQEPFAHGRGDVEWLLEDLAHRQHHLAGPAGGAVLGDPQAHPDDRRVPILGVVLGVAGEVVGGSARRGGEVEDERAEVVGHGSTRALGPGPLEGRRGQDGGTGIREPVRTESPGSSPGSRPRPPGRPVPAPPARRRTDRRAGRRAGVPPRAGLPHRNASVAR